MRKSELLVSLAMAAAMAACNDLTEPLPVITGSYDYEAFSPDIASLNRRGTLTIVDLDPRTARFEGNYQFVTEDGQNMSGQLIGAFIERDRIWFRFLDEPRLFHEGSLQLGRSNGEVFFFGLTYENTGATYFLRLR